MAILEYMFIYELPASIRIVWFYYLNIITNTVK